MHATRPRSTRRSQGGFTLLELIIAMGICLVGLAGLMSLYLTTVQANGRATHTAIASTLGQQVMEELRNMPVQQPDPGYNGVTMETLAGGPIGTAQSTLISRTTTARDNLVYTVTVTANALGPVGDPRENLIFLRATVNWADQGATDDGSADQRLRHQIVFETMRTRQDML
ncbi:type IV pilus modification PilV family protein [Haliangium ochraceum]|uniref:Prepilin-type N-terminal cleavage/methylation domain-containing protein n=1 Tax=Haliangium ochraceum (strain DSM 14365 / JCM 11303 / SMP-2) TaxID=502025 RepID=D0LHJ3_HALO1|nr:prepilin-type N-terminal cleavage/methylation domain-containing protein [Haliangium ochraceum]ACY12855.1 hypothetical protein Hoch_0214 [Haliangium ochraceum DSM 14365]